MPGRDDIRHAARLVRQADAILAESDWDRRAREDEEKRTRLRRDVFRNHSDDQLAQMHRRLDDDDDLWHHVGDELADRASKGSPQAAAYWSNATGDGDDDDDGGGTT